MTARVGAENALLEVAPDAWDALLDELGVADAYLLRSYVEASCLLDPGRPTFLSSGDGVFACIVREVGRGSSLVDATTPYGYGGPVGRAGNPPGERFYELYRAWCAERAVVTTFVRYHPLFENWRSAPPEVVLERLADTASWPLAGADLLADVHPMHRRGARKAERVGVEVSVVVAPRRLADFVSLYEESMRRRSAETFYLFPPAYWETLARLDERLVRLDARLDGELVASLLLLATPPWLHYHLGAASVSGFAVGASKLLFVEAARWGRRHGFAELHLGSGLGGRRDSLWEFKQRFSPHGGRQFWIGKLVHDADAYRELTGDGAVDGFFPRYRALAR